VCHEFHQPATVLATNAIPVNVVRSVCHRRRQFQTRWNRAAGKRPFNSILNIMIEPQETSARGGTWVIVQFLLMTAWLAAAPIWRGQWSGWLTPAIGSVLFALGAWIGLRGVLDLGANRTAYPRPRDDARLITHGIYGRVRHPLYAAMIALGFAWALLWGSFPALALAAVQIPFFDAKARREERWLRSRFSGYANYARKVKRFIPGLYL
jgi:protein-S-isoprenylcysteine O-methyltransferase Ste14